MKRFVILFTLAATPTAVAAQSRAVPAPTSPGDIRAELARAALGINGDDLARRVGLIAHDSMRGRRTPSSELNETARWIASEFQRFGLRPGGDQGGFLQRYPIRMVGPDFGASSVRTDRGGGLVFGADVLPASSTPQPAEARGAAVVLSGGTGFDRARRMQLAGRHVILIVPRDLSRRSRALNQLLGEVFTRGAVSVLLASDATDAEWASAARARKGQRYPSPGWHRRSGPPILEVRDQALARMLAPRGVDVKALRARGRERLRRTAVRNLTLEVVQQVVTAEEQAPNVVGILEGSDPTLRDEYVVFSAHMDHVGVGAPDERGDSIYNGADDDASGTSAVIEIAQAMASLFIAPRRSMIFLLVSGEERGLWGSEYFAENPPVPIESLIANLNLDMVGRNWTDTIVAIGREHSDLGATLERVNAAHPELSMTAIDDLWPGGAVLFPLRPLQLREERHTGPLLLQRHA